MTADDSSARGHDSSFETSAEIASWSDWSEYLQLVRWLAPDVFRHARAKMLAMLVLSGLSVGLRGASAAVLLLFVHAQQHGKAAKVLGISLPSEPTLPNLILWGAAALLAAIASVIASYRCDRLIFDLARSYVEDWSRTVLRFVAAGGAVRVASENSRSGARPVARLMAGSSFRLVRIVIATLSVVVPAITGIAAISVLLATQALLTALLIPIGAAYGWLLGQINQRVMRDSMRRVESSRHHRRDVLRMVSALQNQRFPVGGEPAWLAQYPDRSWMPTALDAYRGVVFAKRRVDYLGDLFQGVALLVILMVFGTVVASGGASWTLLLTYSVALGYAVRSLGRASKFVTAANRSLPLVRRYLTFIHSNPDLTTAGSHLVHGFRGAPPSLEVSDPALPATLPTLTLSPGVPILCMYPVTLENSSLEEFCLALANGDPTLAVELESELFTVQGLGPLPERSLREHLPTTRDPEKQWQAAREVLDALDVWQEFSVEVGTQERVISIELTERLSAPLRLALRLLPGLLSTRRLVAVDHETLELLDGARRQKFFAALGDRVILATAARAPKSVLAEIGAVVVVGLDGVQGIGDAVWFEAVARPAIADWGDVRPALVEEPYLDDEAADDDDDDDV
jgi:hypothetical protein